MRLPRRVSRFAMVLALAVASLTAVAAPAQAAPVHYAERCTKHAWDGGIVVWTCASLHFPGFDIVSAHGEARHTNGPGPVKVRITAVQLWHYNPTYLLERGPATPWETDHAYSHSDYCGYSSGSTLTATLYALVGVDFTGAGQSYHRTVRSYNYNVPVSVLGSSCNNPR
jgi:hypothetical protein